MKKFILAMFLLAASVTLIGVSTQTSFAGGVSKGGDNSNSIPASQVPKPVKASFKAQFPKAKQVEWEFKPVYYGSPIYTASFRQDGQKWEANYHADGTFVSAYPKA